MEFIFDKLSENNFAFLIVTVAGAIVTNWSYIFLMLHLQYLVQFTCHATKISNTDKTLYFKMFAIK